ncbi:glycosyltransferase family 39 protein [Candidatus Roizmanbacteria bacterium]|nr:glycosyltransferase family 39 protein [Candidatus Roizmanbacteria bacterium]
MKKTEQIILLAVIVVAFLVRLYKIDNPVADWHSWRQADTSAVTRNFVKFGFNPLVPRYDDISNVQTGQDNPMGYRFVEFPLYNAISYVVYVFFSRWFGSIEFWERMVSIALSLGTLSFIVLLVKKYIATSAALWSGLFFALLPFSVYYGRTILPENMLLFTSTGLLYFFSEWAEDTRSVKRSYLFFVLSIVFGASALLIKPVAAALLLPLVYQLIVGQKQKLKPSMIVLFLLFLVLIVTPLWLWRNWMRQFPEGIPAWDWLLNGDGIRLKGAFFYWLFAERLAKLILGYYGVFFLVTGILTLKSDVRGWFLHMWAIAMLAYLTIVATGNVKHDYYQIFILPVVAMYAGVGADFVIRKAGTVFSRITAYGVVCIIFTASIAFSWYHIRTYYWINNAAIVEAGKKADEILPKDAKVIASYNGDTAFLYQINRQGWPVGHEIEKKIEKGATYYVSVTPDDPEVHFVQAKHETILQADRFVIVTLQ